MGDEIAAGVDQFFQVLDPDLALVIPGLLVHRPQATMRDDMLYPFRQRLTVAVAIQRLDQVQEPAHRVGSPAAQPAGRQQAQRGLPQRATLAARRFAQHVYSAFTNSPGRRVDHPLEGRIIVAVGHQPQIGQGVLDFGPLEEAQAAVNPVGQRRRDQRFLEYPRLGVGAVENRRVAALAARFHPLADALDHKPRLVGFVKGIVDLERLAVAGIGPQVLAQPGGIVGDERIRRLEDVVGGAVILFQTNGLRAGEIVGEFLNILDFRASPPVDALVVITDDKDITLTAGQQPHPLVLDGVGILEFVHQHVLEPFPVMGQQIRVIAPEFVGAQQQLAEIHQSAALAFLLIDRVDLPVLALNRLAVVGQIGRALEFILATVDEAGHLWRRPLFLIQIQAAQHPLEQPGLIIAVENLESARQAGFLPVLAQQAVGDAVKGADPQPTDGLVQHFFHPTAHLGGGLVGEGDRQDGPGWGVLHRQ